MSEVDIGPHLQPVLSLVVSLDASGITFEIRVIHDTLVLQVTQGSIEVHLLATPCDVHIVFLSQGMTESLIHPVIRCQGIEFAIAIDTIAQSGIRIQSTIGTYQILTIRYGVSDITQATLVAGSTQGRVGCNMGIVCRQALVAHIIIIESLVVSLIIFSRIGDAVVVDGGTAVATPLGIKSNGGFLSLAPLGGHHDDTIGTSGTIKRIRSRILQYGDALHIIRIEIVPSSIVWRTIDDDKR